MKKVSIVLLAAGIAFGSLAGTALAGTAAPATALEKTVDKLIGIDYRWGGTTTAGFDCSGFTSYVLEKLGVDLPRVSRSQATIGVKVAKKDLRPGDLVFFNTNGRGISHVGVYMGDGEFAHSSSKYGVRISRLSEAYYANRYVTARRVLDAEKYSKFAAVAPKAVNDATIAAKQAEPAQPQTEQVTASNTDKAPQSEDIELLDSEEAEETGETIEPLADNPVAAYTEESELAFEEDQMKALAAAESSAS